MTSWLLSSALAATCPDLGRTVAVEACPAPEVPPPEVGTCRVAVRFDPDGVRHDALETCPEALRAPTREALSGWVLTRPEGGAGTVGLAFHYRDGEVTFEGIPAEAPPRVVLADDGVVQGAVGTITGSAPDGVRLVHQGELRPRRTPAPPYPPEALAMSFGEVECVVRIDVDEQGRVTAAEPEDACPMVFHDTLRETLVEWRYRPFRAAGERSAVRAPIRVALVP